MVGSVPFLARYLALNAMLCLMSCFESDEITITTVTKARTLIDYKSKNLSMKGYGMTKHVQGSHKKKGFSPKKKVVPHQEKHIRWHRQGKKRRAKAKLKKDN